MPLHLEALDLSDELRDKRAVLIVSCPICPPASLASDTDSPLMEFFKHGIKTPVYERFIGDLRESLQGAGIRTSVFTSYMPCPATCLWTEGQRKRLLKRAQGHDAVLVMGCESAQSTVKETLHGMDCDVLLAMELVGITNAKLKFEFPLTVRLDGLTRVDANERRKHDAQAMRAL